MRIFFAIKTNDELRAILSQLIKSFQAEIWGSQIRWVHPENLHVTLRFIGACNAEQVSSLIKNVDTAIKQNKTILPFTIQCKHVQLFPTPSRPKIISVGFHPAPELFHLVATVEAGVVNSGFAPETRAFLPHLTLGRFVQHKKPRIEELPLLENYSLPVDEIVLLKSEEIKGKRIYEPIHTFKLLET